MANYVSIQILIDRGKGLTARFTGQPFNVYRITAASTGNVIQESNLITSNFFLRYVRLKGGDSAFETTTEMGTMWFDLSACLTSYLVGDIFIQNDPVFGAGGTSVDFDTLQFTGLCLAQHGPEKDSIGGWLNQTATVYRPSTVPDPTGYFKNTYDNELPVILVNGVFGLGALAAEPCEIPMGILAIPRPRGGDIYKETPNIMEHILYRAYVPPLNGFHFLEGDKIILSDGSRYAVLTPFYQEAGLSGAQLILEREVGGPA